MWFATVFLSTALAAPTRSVHADHLANPPPLPPARVVRRTPPDTIEPPQRMVFGYYASWAGELSDIDFARLTHLAVFNVDLNSDGTVSGMSSWDELGPEAVSLAAPHGVKVQLALTCFDEDVMNVVLPDAGRRGVLVDTLVAAVERVGADGVSVDCEGVPGARRDDLTTLVAELQARVDEVSVAAPAIDWTDAFDKAALSVHADQIFIMGYDYHWGGGDPGPIAPLEGGSPWGPWSLTDSLETYLAEGADPDRIVLGLPLYGRTWPSTNNTVPGTSTGRASSVTMVNGIALAATHGRLYDTVTDTPYTFISSTSQTWYDDHASIQTKVHWAIEAGLGGIGFWALNYEGNDPVFWDMITAETTGLDPVEPVDTGDSGGGTADDGGSGGDGSGAGVGTTGSGSSSDTADGRDDTAAALEPKGTRWGGEGVSCAGAGWGALLLMGPLYGWMRRRRSR